MPILNNDGKPADEAVHNACFSRHEPVKTGGLLSWPDRLGRPENRGRRSPSMVGGSATAPTRLRRGTGRVDNARRQATVTPRKSRGKCHL